MAHSKCSNMNKAKVSIHWTHVHTHEMPHTFQLFSSFPLSLSLSIPLISRVLPPPTLKSVKVFNWIYFAKNLHNWPANFYFTVWNKYQVRWTHSIAGTTMEWNSANDLKSIAIQINNHFDLVSTLFKYVFRIFAATKWSSVINNQTIFFSFSCSLGYNTNILSFHISNASIICVWVNRRGGIAFV